MNLYNVHRTSMYAQNLEFQKVLGERESRRAEGRREGEKEEEKKEQREGRGMEKRKGGVGKDSISKVHTSIKCEIQSTKATRF